MKYWKTTKSGRISYATWSGITNSESSLLRSWFTEQFLTYLRSSSSSYYVEFKKAWPRSELSLLGDASAKNPWPNGISKLDREFPSRNLRKSEESRARMTVDQEIEATSSLKDLINPKSIMGKDFSDYEGLDLMMAADLKWSYDIAFLTYEITERRAVTRQKGRKTFTPSGRLKNVFSGRQLGLVQEETRVVFYTRMPRETVRTTWDEMERRKKFSPGASILFSTESEETDWREKLEQWKGQSWDSSWKFLVYCGQDEKHRRAILDIIPYVVVTSLETDAFMAIVAYFDMLTVKRNPARVRKKVTQGKNSTESWRIWIERFGGTHQKFLGCTWYETKSRDRKGQSGGIIQKSEPRERNPCAPGFEEQPPEETSRQEGCTSKVAWHLARKYASSSRRQLRFILLWRRQRHRRSYVCSGFECWAKLRYSGYFEKVQNPHMRLTATRSSANKRASTSFCSWSRSVRNSAITRWNASDSIAS